MRFHEPFIMWRALKKISKDDYKKTSWNEFYAEKIAYDSLSQVERKFRKQAFEFQSTANALAKKVEAQRSVIASWSKLVDVLRFKLKRKEARHRKEIKDAIT